MGLKFKVKVPGTSANIGVGYDCLGVALDYFLELEVEESNKIEFLENGKPFSIPIEDNLIFEAIKYTEKHLVKNIPSYKVNIIRNDIPISRGLGSSSSAIVAGILIANKFAGDVLDINEVAKLAVEMEGHPDNVAPAIYGNLVIASSVDGQVSAIVADFPECDFLAYIPNYELRTRDSRGVLPKKLSYKEAVAASSIANVAVAALLAGDMVTAGQAIEGDLFHERYRQDLVREFATIKQVAKENGAYATYLSGAGPTVMVLASHDKMPAIKAELKKQSFKGKLHDLKVDMQGVRVEAK